MAERKTKLKVVKIIDPRLCIQCDCAYVAEVLMANGKLRKMFYCSRRDCDNWISKQKNSHRQIGM